MEGILCPSGLRYPLGRPLCNERQIPAKACPHAVTLSQPQSPRPTPSLFPPCSAVLAHIVLQERLNMFGILGCLLCITGSVTIVLHAPPERHLGSVIEVFQLAMQPGG